MRQTIKFLTALLVLLVTGSTGAWAETKDITYLDYVGGTAGFAEATHSATKITSTSDDLSGWYYVEGTVTISRKLYLIGHTHLILCDGAELIINSTNDHGIDANFNGYDLIIYAQSSGPHAGKLTINSMYEAISGAPYLTINGGNISATSDNIDGIYCTSLNINGGKVKATGENTGSDGIYTSYEVTINGGQVTATGKRYGMNCGNGSGIKILGGQVTTTGGTAGIYTDGTITLGWTNATDFIWASSYQGTVWPVITKFFNIEGGGYFSGGSALTTDQKNNIAGKTLTPYAATSFTVSVADGITGGTVVADKTKACLGERVALTVTPADGYILSALSYTDGANTYTVGTAGSYIFPQANDYVITMPASNITVTATFATDPAYMLQLTNGLTNATVTFYDGGAAEPTGFDVTAPGTPVTSADAGQWIVMHIVPADGYWTDAQLLMAMEKAAAPARAKAPGFELGRIPTLLKRDTYTDAASTVLDRQDGAGWYYYQIPADHTCAAGYTTSTIEGYVVRKFNFDTDNATNVSQSGNIVTVTHGTADNWTAEIEFDKVVFPFTGEKIGPEIVGFKIKKGTTVMFEKTSATDIAAQLIPTVKADLRIGTINIRSNAASDYTWFHRSIYGDEVLVGDATYSIVVPFEGSGTADDPWKIKTADDLVLLGKCVNVGGYEFNAEFLAQTANLDMSGATGFQPIGIVDPSDGSYMFCGSYDGKGYTISKINYTNSTAPSYDGAYACMGLFGEVSTTGTINDVTLIDCSFTGSATSSVAYAGGIAGYLKQGKISGCTVKGNSSSVKGLSDGCATGAIVGQRGADGTLSKNYYTYDVSVSNSSGTATGYAKRGIWTGTAWDDVNDATEGAMLLVKKATLPAANANGSTVTFNEVTKGTDRYDRTGDDFYYAVGQTVTINVTTGKRTETDDIRTFYDELSTLTMNDGTTDTDIKEKLAFTMPETDATIAASFSTSTWFTIDTNQKEWMSFYHEWENTAPANYTVSDGSDTGKTIGVKTITGVDRQTGVVTAAGLDGVSYNGVPTLFSCESGLPEKLKFTPNTTATNSVTPNSQFTGTAKALTAAELDALGNGLYVMNGLGEFIRAYDHTGGLAAHRCYINLGSAAAPSRLKIKDETLGISPVVTGSDFSDDNWFSLDGRKLDGKPTKKGLYINGGRKVVIK